MSHGPMMMTKEDMEKGFLRGRILTQEEWAHPQEIAWVDELIAEGKAEIRSPWEYKDTFQCERRRIGAPSGESEGK